MRNLPDFLILEIFAFLNICDKLRCSMVSRRWRTLIKDWKLWQDITVTTELSLYNSLTDEAVKFWGQAWGPYILKLSLSECHWLTDQAVCYIGELCPNLRTLCLTGCRKVSDLGITELSNFCFRLRNINFYHTRITEMGFKLLVESNPGIEIFRLPTQGNCKQMVDAICEKCFKVTELHLQDTIDADTPILNDDTFRTFTEIFPMLQKLSLVFCCQITDRTLGWIASRCNFLTSLHIRECPMISTDGIRSIAELCPLLDDLFLERQSLVTDACCYAIRDHLHYIRSLGLVDTCITDLGIKAIATKGENLRILCVSENCFRAENIKGACLATIAQKCNQLAKLHMYPVTIDDNLLLQLCQNLHQLRDLYLGTCYRVSKNGIRAFIEKCGTLTELRLHDCPSFEDCHLKIVAKVMLRLRRLELQGCHNVTEDGARTFEQLRPNCLLKI